MKKIPVIIILFILLCTLSCTGKKEVKTDEKPVAVVAAPV
jgi:hypothetical protein